MLWISKWKISNPNGLVTFSLKWTCIFRWKWIQDDLQIQMASSTLNVVMSFSKRKYRFYFCRGTLWDRYQGRPHLICYILHLPNKQLLVDQTSQERKTEPSVNWGVPTTVNLSQMAGIHTYVKPIPQRHSSANCVSPSVFITLDWIGVKPSILNYWPLPTSMQQFICMHMCVWFFSGEKDGAGRRCCSFKTAIRVPGRCTCIICSTGIGDRQSSATQKGLSL